MCTHYSRRLRTAAKFARRGLKAKTAESKHRHLCNVLNELESLIYDMEEDHKEAIDARRRGYYLDREP